MLASRELKLGALLLVGGAALGGIYYLFAPGSTTQAAIYDTIGGVSTLAILWGIHANRPRPRLPWLVFALGNALFVAGDAVFDLSANTTSPSTSDVLYLSAYPIFAIAVIMLVVYSGGHHSTGGLLDAGIVTLAFAVFQWQFVMEPAIHSGGTDLGQRIVYGLYPAMDIVLLGAYAGFFISPAWRTPAFMFLVAGFLGQLAGDEATGLSNAAYQEGSWVDFAWMMSYVLWGAAALHPSMRELSVRRRVAEVSFSRWRIAMLSVALLTVPAALVTAHAEHDSVGLYEFAGLSAAISLLVIARLTGTLHAMDRLRIRERDARWIAEDTQKLLVAQNERLLEADRLKDEFVALISHDLRTPLTSIVGYVELALDGTGAPKLDDARRGYLGVAARNAERLVHLVDDLLFVARLQAERLILEPVEIDIAELALGAVEEAQPLAEQGGIALSFVGDGPIRVEADRGRMWQLLDNLISNALKFTPSGGRVEVSAANTPDGAVLEVSDTGIGLAADERERVFERFFRAQRAAVEQVPGTGLGLFIAKAIVEAHGGTISATGRDGGGTTFRIELPQRVASQPDSSTAELVV